MGWLTDKKKQFRAEEDAREEREKKENEATENRRKKAAEELKYFANKAFAEVIGKRTKDNKKVTAKYSDDGNNITLYVDGKEFISLNFYYWESVKYDSDGGGYGSGEYYLKRLMYLYLPHKDAYGNLVQCSMGDSFNEDYLARYLLQFMK